MKTIERTNQRDMTHLVLTASQSDTPNCPHCQHPMASTQHGTFENSMCRCWWVGQHTGDYRLQVVVAETDEGDAAFLKRIAKFEEERRRREAEVARLIPKHIAAVRAALAAKGAHKAVAAIDRGQPRSRHLAEARHRAQAELEQSTEALSA